VDELNPGVILDGIEARFSGDWHQPSYPPGHYYLLALSYLPALALDLVEPRSVPGHTLFFYFGRVLSLVMAVGILLVVYRLGRQLFDSTSGLFSVLIVALAVPFVYYGKTANLDVPVTFWALLSLLFFLRMIQRDDMRSHLLFAVTAVLAMLTKDQAYSFYVLPLLFFGARRLRLSGSFAAAVSDRRVWLPTLVGIASFLLLHNVVFNFQGFVHHFEEILWARGHYSTFEGGAENQLALLFQTARHIGFALSWPLALACALGIAFAWKNRLARWVLLFAVSYYLFFIAPVLSTWLRYSVPFLAILPIFGGRLCAGLWRRGIGLRLVTALAFLYALARAVSVDLLLLDDSRYHVEAWLRENVSEGEVVGYMGPEYYLPRLHALEAKRLRPTETVLERDAPDFLVLNPDFFTRFEPGTREGELFSKLNAGRTSYALVYRRPPNPGSFLLDFEGILANMGKISPPIDVYERAD
jgi:4-amino-4-deoxy-L-arabinose transferase-like glycosyltransferase